MHPLMVQFNDRAEYLRAEAQSARDARQARQSACPRVSFSLRTLFFRFIPARPA